MQFDLHSLFVDLVIVDLGWRLSPVDEGLIALRDRDHCDIWNWVIVHSRIVIIHIINQAGKLVVSHDHLKSDASLFSGGSTKLEVAPLEAAVEHLDS